MAHLIISSPFSLFSFQNVPYTIYLLLLYLFDSAVFHAVPLCSTMYNKMLRFPASVALHQRTQSTQPWPSAHVSIYLMFLHSLVTPVSSISGALQGFRRARQQVIKYQLFSVCHGNPHASFLISKVGILENQLHPAAEKIEKCSASCLPES